MAVGDFNGDGKLDLAVANYGATRVSILLGDGTGNFTLASSPATGAGRTQWRWATSTGTASWTWRSLTSWQHGFRPAGGRHGELHPGLVAGRGYYPASVAVGDFNGDGKLDLAVADTQIASLPEGTVSILLRPTVTLLPPPASASGRNWFLTRAAPRQ